MHLAGKTKVGIKMVSYRETRNLLLLSHANKIIDDEELLLLFDLNKSKNPEISYWSYAPFYLEEMTDDDCYRANR